MALFIVCRSAAVCLLSEGGVVGLMVWRWIDQIRGRKRTCGGFWGAQRGKLTWDKECSVECKGDPTGYNKGTWEDAACVQ